MSYGMVARPGRPLEGIAKVPGDKSISHRALILGALTVGETTVSGLLEAEDVLSTAKAMQALGAQVESGGGAWKINGVGVGGFAEPGDVLDCGNSGTGVRLIMGAVATTPIRAVFTGDASLRARPMARVLDPLSLFGAKASSASGGRLPVTIEGAKFPVPVNYESEIASAQVKSAILLAGLNAPGQTVYSERTLSRDHTERMLRGFGAEVETRHESEWHVTTLTGYPELSPLSLQVPADPSSAAFPICAALVAKGSRITVPGVGANPTRTGLYETLREMGARVEFTNPRESGGEAVADISAEHSALRGVRVPPERAPSMIDEYPILAVAAAFAEGETVMSGIGEMRVKESDRISAIARALEACGVSVSEREDSLTVYGAGADGVRGGAECEARMDHRIAMSCLCLGMAAQNPVTVDDASSIATSFPQFRDLMAGLGADLGES